MPAVEGCRSDRRELYWSEKVAAALRVKEVKIRGEGLYMTCQALGTQCEAFLKAASGLPGRVVEAHLCPSSCPGTPHAENLLHVRRMKCLGAHREGWMSNLMSLTPGADREDEMADLRKDRATLAPGGSRVRAPPRGGDDRKEKKDRKSKKRRRSAEHKVEAVKNLKSLFQATGLDPDEEESGQDSKEEAGRSLVWEQQLLRGDFEQSGGAGPPVRQFQQGPEGCQALPRSTLCRSSRRGFGGPGQSRGGVWDLQGSLPPLFCRYYRHQLAHRMSPAMSREAHTLSYALDLMLRGRSSEMMDFLAQRLKSLEMMAGGVHFTVSQQQELLTRDTASMSSVQEFQEAKLRSLLD